LKAQNCLIKISKQVKLLSSSGKIHNLVKQCVPDESLWSLVYWTVLCWEACMSGRVSASTVIPQWLGETDRTKGVSNLPLRSVLVGLFTETVNAQLFFILGDPSDPLNKQIWGWGNRWSENCFFAAH